MLHKKNQKPLLISLLLSFTLFSSQLFAASQLMISPTRIMFDKRDRSAQVQLINRGDEAGTYRITFVNKRITENGDYLDIPKGTEGAFSDKMIRYSPRQITLPAGKSQTIRLLLRKPSSLAEGEYRSHLMFMTLPKKSLNDISKLKNDGNKISISLTPLVGITIPVIVRHGSGETQTSLSDLSLITDTKTNKTQLKLTINRTGELSVYGDIKVVLIDKSGSKNTIANLKGLSVYPPSALRQVTLNLNLPKDGSLAQSKIHVTYTSAGDNKGKLLSQSTLDIN